MITILHGDDISATRNRAMALLEGATTERLDGKKVKSDVIIRTLISDGLFSNKKTVFIENLSSIGAAELKSCLPHLTQQEASSDIDVFILEEKVLDKRFLSKFVKAKVEAFTLPKHFFTFIDGFAPKNAVRLHNTLFKLYPQFAAEQIFYALINRLRLLLMLKTGTERDYEELAKMAPWQKSKVAAQAKSWTESDIISFYKKLFDTEVALKSSALTLPLINHLDFLIITELQ